MIALPDYDFSELTEELAQKILDKSEEISKDNQIPSHLIGTALLFAAVKEILKIQENTDEDEEPIVDGEELRFLIDTTVDAAMIVFSKAKNRELVRPNLH
jgi:hypothetical protein|tara:strand:+ start:2022 stop:2321 length:300 start_codon:yes stop_codon:yes gene_type:complete